MLINFQTNKSLKILETIRTAGTGRSATWRASSIHAVNTG